MAVKQVRIMTPGGAVSMHIAVTPETTAGDALKEVGLGRKYVLSTPTGDGFFQRDDKLDGAVEDGQTLYASLWAELGRPLAVVLFVLRAVCRLVRIGDDVLCFVGGLAKSARASGSDGPAQGGDSESNEEATLRSAGWYRCGDYYLGTFHVNEHRLDGEVRFRSPWDSEFLVRAPLALINGCGDERSCFLPQQRPSRSAPTWFKVHFERRPRSAAGGIAAVEETLTRSKKARKSA